MHAIAFDQAGYHSEGWTPVRSVAAMSAPRTAADGFADMIGAIAAHADRAAFAALFEHFAPRVKSYMLRLGAEPQLAEELAQETMLDGLAQGRCVRPRQGGALDLDFHHRPQPAHRRRPAQPPRRSR